MLSGSIGGGIDPILLVSSSTVASDVGELRKSINQPGTEVLELVF